MANCWECENVNTQMCEGCKNGYMDGIDGWVQFNEPTHFIPSKRAQGITREEQETVPFDFELYKAGLMDMPKGMIEVLDQIMAEICDERNDYSAWQEADVAYGLSLALEIIDKYRKGHTDADSD